MKILVARFAPEYGGAERSFVNHLVGLKELGHEVVALTNVSIAQAQLKKNHIRYYESWWWDSSLPRFLRTVLLTLPQLWQWLIIIRKENPAILNLHSYFDQIWLTLLKPLHRRAVVWKDPADLKYYLRPKSGLKYWLYVKAVNQVDYIYTISKYERRQICRLLPDYIDKSKIVVIHTGLNLSDYNLKVSRPRPAQDFLVGFVGRLDALKGPKYLIEAAPLILRRLPRARFWIIGQGKQLEELKLLSRSLVMEDFIKFWGYQADVAGFINALDVLVLPSLNDGWSLTVHEARFLGKAIVASRVGGVPEQIQDGVNGLLVSPGKPEAIAQAVVKIAKNPRLRAKLQQAARASALNTSDFKTILKQQIIPLFERAASETKP